MKSAIGEIGQKQDFFESDLAKFAALLLPLAITFSATETRAQSPSPLTANIPFTYSGVNPGTPAETASGAGSFTFTIPDSSSSNIPISALSAFQFSQTTTVVNPPPNPPTFSGTFNYGLGNVTSFSLDFDTPQASPSNILSLQTNSVASSPPIFVPQAFSVNAENAQAFIPNNSQPNNPQIITSGTVTLDQQALMNALVRNAVKVDPIVNGTAIRVTFSPNFNATIDTAARLSGFTRFDWVQTVTSDPTHAAFLTAGSPPFNDPPGSARGTSYCTAGSCETFPFQMILEDQPANSCFSSSAPCVVGVRIPVGSSLMTTFATDLVGVSSNGQQTPLFEVHWASNYTGAQRSPSGGVEIYQYGSNTFDDGSGTGGVVILSETFFPNAAVPEPSTWAMMLLGFAGLGFAFRRSRRKVSFA